ncbi:amino acid adenylation domain-containing protein [Butyrivibrio fibrisolvens DSM 3071]|uniref:Amino acid adenylation domain-containing protein n=1 Tax=Butyrivibrio fibrisolvens DSM 3071 TaxID=1121131 RepID=A0A1M6FAA3_BUTFI|nr:amino acid adenylation domain-containing protein [Butyrivibrio fibrisolvens]SHI94539.1 amino acid adenylation domain-containing protein [Butyrivibrio fibrisolvens DSM 3071]
MQRSIIDWLLNSTKERPDAVAVSDPDKEYTYTELLNYSKNVAAKLLPYVKPCHAVAFYMEKSADGLCGMMGTAMIRGFYSFIDVRAPQARIDKMLEILEPDVIITDENFKDKAEVYSDKFKVVTIEELLTFKESESSDIENNAGKNNEVLFDATDVGFEVKERMLEALDTDPLYVNFTSGSTGVPKGVMVNHRSVIDFIDCFTDIFGINSDDTMGNQAPFDFDVSVKDIYSCLKVGARLQIIPRAYFSAPTTLMDYLVDNKVTVLVWAVSAMCFVSIMNGLGYKVPENIRMIMFSGEVMPSKHLNTWQKYIPDAEYINLYGPTEITCNCTYYRLPKGKILGDSETLPAGKAFPNEKVFLLDDEDNLVDETSVGTMGEICVGGTCVAVGYYKNPEKTAESFVQNPLNTAYPERIYRTGDIGKYDENGDLIYVSRKDFQIKHLGQRIELGEIENAATSIDGVTRACCLYDFKKKKLILCVTGSLDGREITSALREIVPQFMVPNKVVVLEEMPLNKNGKIDRTVLNSQYTAQ